VGGRVYVLLSADQESEQTPDHTAELIRTLQEQLAAERPAHAEARRLLMAALERIPPQLEAPQEAPESPETVEDAPARAEPRSSAREAQEGAERRPWWQRLFEA
jgi:hypothetical protein